MSGSSTEANDDVSTTGSGCRSPSRTEEKRVESSTRRKTYVSTACNRDTCQQFEHFVLRRRLLLRRSAISVLVRRRQTKDVRWSERGNQRRWDDDRTLQTDDRRRRSGRTKTVQNDRSRNTDRCWRRWRKRRWWRWRLNCSLLKKKRLLSPRVDRFLTRVISSASRFVSDNSLKAMENGSSSSSSPSFSSSSSSFSSAFSKISWLSVELIVEFPDQLFV